ncbi:histidine kinase [Myxococcota bacterium]|nr:histidine kinase [Myxococcota bacterium]MBU1411844.1 histidine kinase [Myxococcota bacterium]MBU1508795.1 histidine kinase [Myxococcota bacterium]
MERTWLSRNLVPYYLAWIPMAVMVTMLLLNRGNGPAFSIIVSLLFCLPMAAVGAGARFMCRALPLKRQRMAIVLSSVLVSGLVFSGIWAGVFMLVLRLSRMRSPAQIDALALALFLLGVAAFIFTLLYHYLVEAAEQVRRAQHSEDEARVQLGMAQLRALRAQVNPHFLFNSLNSVAALIGSDPAAAREMVVRLATFFRATIAAGRQESIPLVDELALLRNYLEIEKVRFDQRLVVEEEIDPALLNLQWPPLLLQPLAENAVKYGVSSSAEPVRITLTGMLEPEYAVLSFHNGFDRAGLPAPGTGTGLAATRERFERFFGEGAAMTVEAADGEFRVTLRVHRERLK